MLGKINKFQVGDTVVPTNDRSDIQKVAGISGLLVITNKQTTYNSRDLLLVSKS